MKREPSSILSSINHPIPAPPRSWDARLARWIILPLVSTSVTPNHLTTVRLLIGLLCAVVFAHGGYAWSNLGALLLMLSCLADHADGELARMSGKTSRFGHLYDLGADALTMVLLFVGIGAGLAGNAPGDHMLLYGIVSGIAITLIFYLRMQIEEQAGKASTKQPAWGGFELEDVLYLMPLVTLTDTLSPFLIAAAIGSPLFAIWVIIDFARSRRQQRYATVDTTVGPKRR